MPHPRRLYISVLLVAIFSGNLAYQSAANPVDIKQTTDIAVVVNPKNPVDDLSLSSLKKIVLGDRLQWPNKAKVAIAFRVPGSREYDVILSRVAEMTQGQFKQSWLAHVFRGETDAEPFTVPSNGAASAYVEVNTGAIAFMPGTDVRRDLKVLKINGVSPGEPNYPLK